MKLIIGLGNPGDKYINNRHNVGHQLVDFLNNPQSVNSLINNEQYLIINTDCFMNQSGEFVKKILDKHQNIKLDDVYIVHDDLDIPLGKFKIDHATGPKLHNGIRSIEETLKTKDFWRIRIGVDNPSTRFTRSGQVRLDGEKYVLSDFTIEERPLIHEIFKNAVDKLLSFIHNEIIQ